jgi:hypothetical protein
MPAVAVQPREASLLAAWHAGRFMHLVISCGELRLHVLNVYMVTGGWSELNEDLLRASLEHAARLGRVPVLILGDLQCDVSTYGCWEVARAGGWEDAASRWSPTSLRPTFFPARGTPSPLDFILGNREALRMVIHLSIGGCGAVVGHRAVAVTLSTDAALHEVRVRRRVTQLPLEGLVDAGDLIRDCGVEEVGKARAAWEAARARGDLDNMLDLWHEVAQATLTRACEAKELPVRDGAPRGVRDPLVTRRVVAHHVKRTAGDRTAAVEGEACMALRRIAKLIGWMEELRCHLAKQGPEGVLPDRLWALVVKAERGLADAEKRADRLSTQGLIGL